MAKKCLDFEFNTPPTQSYDKAHSVLHTKNFQKKLAVLSKCGAITLESAFKIVDLTGFNRVKQARSRQG